MLQNFIDQPDTKGICLSLFQHVVIPISPVGKIGQFIDIGIRTLFPLIVKKGFVPLDRPAARKIIHHFFVAFQCMSRVVSVMIFHQVVLQIGYPVGVLYKAKFII
ncbi:hypothetical protein SDC9_138019 [bioreactor metagenome]|uniref:Uncharacterized protein n=1 Tax=bioreactor metagenome TaxID=1076179 RepID=A0A645DNM3_9ZZZZ